MKKGRENNQFLPRKFVLSEIDNTIKYYVKVIKWCRDWLSPIHTTIQGSKGPESSDQDFGHQCCLQSHQDSFSKLPPNWLPEGEPNMWKKNKVSNNVKYEVSKCQHILFKDGSTRHIYVYHDDPQTVVNWYHAIRCCKLHLLQVP